MPDAERPAFGYRIDHSISGGMVETSYCILRDQTKV